jgi:CPA2 family monovalent cation:H+ antiporter-2
MPSNLVANLALTLMAALLGAIVATRLRMSAVIGYIAAGVFIGPFTPGFVADPHAVEQLADLGLVFLLFAIGAELSLRDLARAGTVALLGGSLQVVVTIAIGALVGTALGWQLEGALFFGAVVAISSGAVISKILSDRGELESDHGRIAMAWSTVQDLATIVLVVLLPALSVEGSNRIQDVLLALGKAALFLALLVPLGLRGFPALFEWLARLRNRELFVLAVASVALGTAYASTLFGVSLALGAFVAGLAIGESELSHQVLAEIAPLRNVLAGLFFVSIGMLVDPMFIGTHVPLVLLAILLMVVVKAIVVGGSAALMGSPLRTAILVGVALAQSGEFSFLLARLGLESGSLTADAFNLILSGAAISIVLTPPLQAVGGRVVRRLERSMTRGVEVGEAVTARRHAIICGYGDVGRVIGAALARRDFSFVAIDHDPRVVRSMREKGISALLGSADNPIVLDRAGLERARVLVVALPDALAARQIVEYARRGWPRLDIVARTHSEDEMRQLQTMGVNEAVSGEIELALEMARHTLRRFGVSAAETLAILQGFRSRAAEQDE